MHNPTPKPHHLRIPLLPDERWWGGRVADGQSMPFGGAPFRVDLSTDLNGNQGSPLLISSRGRFVWSEEPFSFCFDEGELEVQGRGQGGMEGRGQGSGESPTSGESTGELVYGEGHGSLRQVYQHVSRTYFPPVGIYPGELLFTAPQYNLWIELLYEPTQEKVLRYAHSVLEQGMPPGVLMIDDNWHGPYGTWQFDLTRFPDPKAMVDELHSLGFKVMLWLCPFVSPDSRTYRMLEKKGYLLRDETGKVAIRHWWNGYSAVLDCTHESAVQWLQEQLGELQERFGIDGYKFDAGDPVFYEPSDLASTPSSRNGHCMAWSQVGLRYSYNEYRASWKMAGQPLVQRLKDKAHSWESDGLAALIPDAIAMGLLGYAFVCPDMIGGGEYVNFLENSDHLDQELVVRYAQCSALFPMMQFSVAPWRILDDEHLSCCVAAARLHSEFEDEVMRLAKHAAQTGEPILRHLEYVFPYEGFEAVQDQFMLGDEILVAPVLEKGARQRLVHFPPGTWVGDDQSVVHGPCRVNIDVPLRRLPWYRKL